MLKTHWIGLSIVSFLYSHFVLGDITLDGTLGSSGPLNGPDYVVEASHGKQIGSNLFHSFSQFNIYQNESATFTGPDSINNVISRVTGGDLSTIAGELSVQIPSADFWLINPAGIVVTDNASINIDGALYLTTADYISLDDGGRFDATNPENSILSVAEPAAFGFLDNETNSIAFYTTIDTAGHDIGIISEEVNLSGAEITTKGGDIYLASVSGASEISKELLKQPGLEIKEDGTITLVDTALDTSGDGAGGIVLQAGDILLESSKLLAESKGGTSNDDIIINADTLTATKKSEITSITSEDSTADGSNIHITANHIIFPVNPYIGLWSSRINSITNGDATSGDIHITTNEFLAQGIISLETLYYYEGKGWRAYDGLGWETFKLVRHGAGINFESNGTGDTGSFHIDADTINLDWHAEISTVSNGTGRSTDLDFSNVDIVSLSNDAKIFSENKGTGVAGDILFDGNRKVLLGSNERLASKGTIGSYNHASGNGGSIYFRNIDDLMVMNDSSVISETTGTGVGGLISIDVKDLYIQHSRFTSNSLGAGNGGDIELKAERLLSHAPGFDKATLGSANIRGGVFITRARGSGDGGSIYADIGEIVERPDKDDIYPIESGGAGFSTLVQGDGTGGDINITVHNELLNIANFSISSSTYGSGSSGDITLNANDIVIGREVPVADIHNSSATGIFSRVANSSIATGNGGDITLNARNVHIFGNRRTESDGNGGPLKNSGVYSITNGPGHGGDIAINAKTLTMEQSGTISTQTDVWSTLKYVNGNAGDIHLNIEDAISLSDPYTGIYSRAVTNVVNVAKQYTYGNAGDIVASADTIELLNAAVISSISHNAGKSGNISLTAKNIEIIGNDTSPRYALGRIVENPGGIFTAAYDYAGGKAGDIYIKSDNVRIGKSAIVSAKDATFSPEIVKRARKNFSPGAGSITMDVKENIYIDGKWTTVEAQSGWSKAGSVNLSMDNLHLTNGASIIADGGYQGSNGSITLHADHNIAVSDNGTRIDASVNDGNGKGITITGETFKLSNGALLATSTKGVGDAGEINIHADEITVENYSTIDSKTTGVGRGGDIKVEGGNLYIDSSQISAASTGSGDAGDIEVNTTDSILLSNSKITTAADSGGGGSITLNTVNMLDLADSTVATSVAGGDGNAGNISIDPIIVNLENSSILAQAFAGNGGNISIRANIFSMDTNSIIDASSTLGIDGGVDIDTPFTINEQLDSNKTGFIKTTNLMQTRCSAKAAYKNSSSFVTAQQGALPVQPGSYLNAQLTDMTGFNTVASASNNNNILMASNNTGLITGCN